MRRFLNPKAGQDPVIQRARDEVAGIVKSKDIDTLQRIVAETTWEVARDEWAARWTLKESRGHACICRVVRGTRGRCSYGRRGSPCAGPDCFCNLRDHGTLWNFDGKPAVYVGQPYGPIDPPALRALADFADAHNLRVYVDNRPSWHFPGRVLTVEFWNPLARVAAEQAAEERRKAQPARKG